MTIFPYKPSDNQYTLRKKCAYSELFWSIFSRIRTEYWEILLISPYSVRMQENGDQNNSESGHILRSDRFLLWYPNVNFEAALLWQSIPVTFHDIKFK